MSTSIVTPPVQYLDDIHLPQLSHPQRAAYWERGSGLPILMLHGFMGSKATWEALSEVLAPHYHCLALDLFGFGESSQPKIHYDLAQEVAFVRQVVQRLQLDPCIILGHSFGGWVAASYGLTYPESVTRLLLAAPAGIRDDSFCGRYDALRPLLWTTPLVDWVLQGVHPLAQWLGKGEEWQTIRWYRRELLAQPVARSFLASRLRPEDAVDTVESEIHHLSMPTLVLAGEMDETIPLWHCQTYAERIPRGQLQVLPGAGHDLIGTQAQELGEAMVEFLASCQDG